MIELKKKIFDFIDGLENDAWYGKPWEIKFPWEEHEFNFRARKSMNGEFSFIVTISKNELDGVSGGFYSTKLNAFEKIILLTIKAIDKINDDQKIFELLKFENHRDGFHSGNLILNVRNFLLDDPAGSLVSIAFQDEATYRAVMRPSIHLPSILNELLNFLEPIESLSLSNETRDMLLTKEWLNVDFVRNSTKELNHE